MCWSCSVIPSAAIVFGRLRRPLIPACIHITFSEEIQDLLRKLCGGILPHSANTHISEGLLRTRPQKAVTVTPENASLPLYFVADNPGTGYRGSSTPRVSSRHVAGLHILWSCLPYKLQVPSDAFENIAGNPKPFLVIKIKGKTSKIR